MIINPTLPPSKSTTTPAMNGTASAGTETAYAAGDHVHPTDTSRAPSSHSHGSINNSGRITSDTTIANGDKLVITDSSGSNAVKRSNLAINTSVTNKFLRNDGTWNQPAAGDLTGQVAVANGGTGASTAANARTNLDAAQSNGASGTLYDAEQAILVNAGAISNTANTYGLTRVEKSVGNVTIPSSGYVAISSNYPTGTQFAVIATWSSISPIAAISIAGQYLIGAANTTVNGLKIWCFVRPSVGVS